MQNLRGKRGIELSMNVIIIAIILVIVLVIVVLFFTGGVTNSMNKIKALLFTQTVDLSTAQIQCNNYCNQFTTNPNQLFAKKNFCETSFNVDTNGDGKKDQEFNNCIQLGVSCEAIPSCSA